MSKIKLYSVGQIAESTGVSVRTMHFYDEIGLLKPAIRKSNGRRLYDRDSVLRLQQILTYRTLGLALNDIARMLDDPESNRRETLIAQRAAVVKQIAQNKALLRGIDEALLLVENSKRKDIDMETLFGGFDTKQFADEAEAKWGETESWAISQRRTSEYTKEDWARYQASHNKICNAFAELASSDAKTDSTEALDLAEQYAKLINNWFYPCDVSHLGGLADMYEADARFRQTFDAFGDRTAEFIIAAFRASTALNA